MMIFRTPSRSGAQRRRRLPALVSMLGLVCALGVVVPAGPAAAVATVVSLTFDDGSVDQYDNGRPILAEHGMAGTFYVNSSRMNGMPGYMSQAQVGTLAAEGHEIGGHTVDHPDLVTLSSDDRAREICNDRVALLALGLDVRNFAYPFGSTNAATKSQVAACGYNSARGIGGLVSPGGCGGCPTAAHIPPTDPYLVPTSNSIKTSTTLAQLQGLVTQAEQSGGGWVPIAFHHVCNGCDPAYAVSPAVFDAFLDWLQPRSSTGTVVQRVSQVIGGTLKPGVPGPPRSGSVRNPSLEEATGQVPNCFQLGGYGTSTVTWTRTGDAHTGSFAERVDVSGFVSGDRKLVTKQDAGACAPGVTPGTNYTVGLWYRGSWVSSVPVKISVYLRAAAGTWTYWTTSGSLPASATWQQATVRTPPVPSGNTGISFGLSLAGNGWLVSDDYSLVAG